MDASWISWCTRGKLSGLPRRRAGSDHVLPIWTKRDMLDPDHVALARPLEGQDVVAASDPFRRIRVEFLLAAVEAGLDDFLDAASGQEISKIHALAILS